MLHAYLTAKSSISLGPRGGLHDEIGDSVLEISNDSRCTPEIMAYAAHIKEIKGLLESICGNEKALVLAKSIAVTQEKLTSQVQRSRNG